MRFWIFDLSIFISFVAGMLSIFFQIRYQMNSAYLILIWGLVYAFCSYLRIWDRREERRI
jgi:hypothetical protein